MEATFIRNGMYALKIGFLLVLKENLNASGIYD